ncbi:Type 1 phosphatases regulator ypi1 [Coemansia sp. RSA 1933]|nr:Type 1 phosphatases regulator ypi1 [Coemansia sp. RSA 1933]
MLPENTSSSTGAARDNSSMRMFQSTTRDVSLLTHISSDSNMLSPRSTTAAGRFGERVMSRSNVPSHGSRTMVLTPNEESNEPSSTLSGGVLFLRGSSVSSQDDDNQQARSRAPPHVRWTDDTVDNEDMGKKKSKVCCIYRKERQFGESDSDETDSSCGSDSDDSPNEYERMPRYGKPKRHNHDHSRCH